MEIIPTAVFLINGFSFSFSHTWWYSVGPRDQDKNATQAIFNTKTLFPLTKSIKRVMQEWSNNPRKTIIADFEYNVRLLKTLKHEAIFQIAISNALGEWIVPASTINHCMSRREYFEKLKVCSQQYVHGNDTFRGSLWKHQFAMYYGSANEMPTEAMQDMKLASVKEGRMSTSVVVRYSKEFRSFRIILSTSARGVTSHPVPRAACAF